MATQPKRNRIPKLSDAGLKAALSGLDSLKVSKETRQIIKDMLTAAASEDALTPDAVLAGMKDERRESVAGIAKAVARHGRSVTKRAKTGLLDLSESEWQALVDEANQE